MSLDPLMQSYLQLLLFTTGATSVSLFLAPVQNTAIQCFHRGGETLPEVADQQQLNRLVSQHADAPRGIRLVPSQQPHGAILSVTLSSAPPPCERIQGGLTERRQTREEHQQHRINHFWLALRFTDRIPSWLTSLATGQHPQPQWPLLLQQGVELFSFIQLNQLLIRDPLTRLPGRQEFNHYLNRDLKAGHALTLLQINPKNFHRVNKKFGRECGDRVIREIAERLTASLRQDDLLSRFGGALFAVALNGVTLSRAREIADKLCHCLCHCAYLRGAIELDFSIGIGHSDNAQKQSPEDRRTLLHQHSDQALLAAHVREGCQVVIWESEDHNELSLIGDRLSGIFTADTTTDYRNMLLLWDIANITATECVPEALLRAGIHRLQEVFSFNNAGLLILDDDQPQFTIMDPGDSLFDKPQFNQQYLPKLQQALDQGTSLVLEQGTQLLYAIPLPGDSPARQLFWFQGPAEQLQLDHHAQLLLSALARQLGRALSRARLEEEAKLRQQQTVDSLRSMVGEHSLVFCSPQMQTLMTQARRAAQTDITMLISGESGTGKGELTKAIHQMSERRHHPLVVVDCSAIPESLIESELFGHEKGAFTGAHQRRNGRIVEAHQGTLMLDEIGELPLLVQSKLLRLVQEKQLQSVGSNKVQEADVRIIAVTNRDLQAEVQAGRFREDLYYRLNVLELKTPPLRERSGDLLYLCEHFLATFAQQYQMAPKTLSPQAIAVIENYSWPGNIRQLQNRLLQAAVLCDSPQLQPGDLHLSPASSPQSPIKNRSEPIKPMPVPAVDERSQGSNTEPPLDKECWWQQLGNEFDRQIDHLLNSTISHDVALASWLETELIHNTYQMTDANARQAAKRLGLVPSTFRRKLDKILTAHPNGLPARPHHWTPLAELLNPVVRGELWSREGLFEQIHQLLLERVIKRIGDETSTAARLMSVSEVTLQRWLKSRAPTNVH